MDISCGMVKNIPLFLVARLAAASSSFCLVMCAAYGLRLRQRCSPHAGSRPGQDDRHSYVILVCRSQIKLSITALLWYTKVALSSAPQISVPSFSVPVFIDAWRLISWLEAEMFFEEGGLGGQARLQKWWLPSQTFQEVHIEGVEEIIKDMKTWRKVGSWKGWREGLAVCRRKGLSMRLEIEGVFVIHSTKSLASCFALRCTLHFSEPALCHLQMNQSRFRIQLNCRT